MVNIVNPSRFETGGGGGSQILDSYTPTAIYDFRAHGPSVTNVCRLERSSDSTQRDFTADELIDGTLDTWAGSGSAYVVTMYDQTSNGNDITTTGSPDNIVYDTGSPVEDASGNIGLKLTNAFGITNLNGGTNVSTTTLLVRYNSDATNRNDIYGWQAGGAPVFHCSTDNSIRFNNGFLGGSVTATTGIHYRFSVQASNVINEWIDDTSNISSGSAGGRTYTDEFYASMGAGRLFFGAIVFLTDETANRSDLQTKFLAEYA